jgi:Mycobacterium membrane protein
MVFRVLKKVWMPLLLVVVVALGAYAVVRIRDTIGAHEPASAGAGNCRVRRRGGLIAMLVRDTGHRRPSSSGVAPRPSTP